MSADPNGRRLHLWTALVLVAVFTAGAATGAGLAWALRPDGPPRPPPRPGAPRHGADGLPPPLAGLGLSPEQERGVRAILEARRPELEKAIEEAFPRVRAVQDSIDREIAALLTPEQAARFEAQRNRRSARPGPGPMGAPPPGMPGPR